MMEKKCYQVVMLQNNENMRLIWGTGFILVLIKLILLVQYGPVHMPDSSGYTVYAEMILTEPEIFSKVPWVAAWGHSTTFRSIGYPLFLALHKIVAGSYYDWTAVLTQMALSLMASVYIYRLAVQLFQKQIPSLFCGVAHALGQSLTLDQCLLTDSLNASLLIILMSMLGLKILKVERPGFLSVTGLGILVMLAFLVREAGSFLQYLYWPLVLFWIWQHAESKKRFIFMTLCFVAPMVLATNVYKSWNEYRTGERFVTTAGRTTMFFPALNLKDQGIDAFQNDPKLQNLPDYIYPLDQNAMANVGIINKHLMDNFAMTPIEISRYAFSKFFGYWVEFPLGMAVSTLSEIREKQLFIGFMPLESGMMLDFWQSGTKPFQKRRDMMQKVESEGRFDLLVLYIGRHMERVVSVVITIAFVLGIPWFLINRFRTSLLSGFFSDPKNFTLLMFWLIYFGYTFAYAMVHMEQRYLVPVVPFSVICGVYILLNPVTAWISRFRNHFLKKGS